MRNLRGIAIVGGGIGGLATAVALRCFKLDVAVYEKTTALREFGAGMMLWPNATRVLAELGLLDRVLACSGPNTDFLVRSSSGRILMHLALGQFEVPAVCVRRSDLLRVLLDALPQGCIRLARELDGLEQQPDRVRLHFSDGTFAEHDAVIGADGIRSQVRALLFGAAEPIYRGYVVWRGLAGYEGDAVPAGCNSETWGVGRRFGILNTGHRRFTWYATANVPSSHLDAVGGRKNELCKMFANWHEPIHALIEASEEGAISKHGARDLAPTRSWGRGLVTLLGDAAHSCTPNLGQGGCMALEDALVLAKCLADDSCLQNALRRYEIQRMRRTRGMQQRSRWIGFVGQWQNRFLVTSRDRVTAVLPPRLVELNLRRIYGYRT
jgi:2-polyprenyl-6-methoxyphenol hydroxylase-like FAD-dependent oxidoreductase